MPFADRDAVAAALTFAVGAGGGYAVRLGVHRTAATHLGHGYALVLAGGHRSVDRGVGPYADTKGLGRDPTANAGPQRGRLALSLGVGD